MSERIYHPHPGGLEDAEWFKKLPDPDGQGRVSMATVKQYHLNAEYWVAHALDTRPRGRNELPRQHVRNERIEKFLAALGNAHELTQGGKRPLPESESYKAISGLHREAFGLWPDAMRKMMPFGEVIRRLRQCRVEGNDETQLEHVSHLEGYGLLAGLDVEGNPLFTDIRPVFEGLSYNEAHTRATKEGFCFMPRGLPSRSGTNDGKSYEERMIAAAFGARVAPAIRGTGHLLEEPKYHSVYLDSPDTKAAYATGQALAGKRQNKDAPNQDSYSLRTYSLKDLDLKR